MALVFSAADLKRLAEVARVIASPLDFATVDAWRAAVNDGVKALLGGDSAGFLLPGAEGMALYSREHDPDALNRYPEIAVPSLTDGTNIWSRVMTMRTGRLQDAYGAEYGKSYLRSEYYNEFAAPNGARETMFVAATLDGPNNESAATAALQIWHGSRRGRRFGAREVALLELVGPLFQSAVNIGHHWRRERLELIHALDRLGKAAVVWNLEGKILHQTAALCALLAQPVEGPDLSSALRTTFDALRPLAQGHVDGGAVGSLAECPSFATATPAHRINSVIYGHSSAVSAPLIVATVESSAPVAPDEWRDEFGLTKAECRVAQALMAGESNHAISERLGISPHTARRHTEHVLAKLGVRSRAAVATRLVTGRRPPG